MAFPGPIQGRWIPGQARNDDLGAGGGYFHGNVCLTILAKTRRTNANRSKNAALPQGSVSCFDEVQTNPAPRNDAQGLDNENWQSWIFQAIVPSGQTLLGGGRSKLYDGMGLTDIVIFPSPQAISIADKPIATAHIPRCLVCAMCCLLEALERLRLIPSSIRIAPALKSSTSDRSAAMLSKYLPIPVNRHASPNETSMLF